MRILFFLFSIIFILEVKSQHIFNSDIILLDTIEVSVPVVLKFNESFGTFRKYTKTNFVLLSKNELNSLKKKDLRDYKHIISQMGYKIYSTCKMFNILNNALFEKEDLILREIMMEFQRQCEDKSSVGPFSEPVKYKRKQNIIEMKTSKYIIFLVSIKLLNEWDGKQNSIQLKDMDNCYIKLAVPVRF